MCVTLLMYIMFNTNIVTHNMSCALNLGLVTNARKKKTNWENVIGDLNTLLQVWENVSQHSQMNFPLGELNSYEVHDFWHKSARNKISKLGP
jgi:hypothetical protein